MVAAIASVALACSNTNGRSELKRAPSPEVTHKASQATAPTRATMDIEYRNLPDDQWRHAAEIVVAAWHGPLTEEMSAKVVVRPWKSPDGASVPYLLFIETFKADGSPGFRSTVAVWGEKLANGGGAAAATGFLAAAGFPARHISLGHMLEILYVTGAIDVSWLVLPSAVGWDGVTRPFLGTDLVRTLDYTATGAVLHLYRGVGAGPGSTAPPSGGGFEPPAVERLDVTFDARARFTTTILRQNPARTAWYVVH